MSKRKKNKKNKKINVEIENNAVEEAVSEDVETVSNDVIEDYDDMMMLVNDTDEVEEVAEDNGPATELVDDEAEVAEERHEESEDNVGGKQLQPPRRHNNVHLATDRSRERMGTDEAQL